jgi:hypothetical protein
VTHPAPIHPLTPEEDSILYDPSFHSSVKVRSFSARFEGFLTSTIIIISLIETVPTSSSNDARSDDQTTKLVTATSDRQTTISPRDKRFGIWDT